MTAFTPTDEQLAIINAAKTTKDNLCIKALAGASKTTTLELICKALWNTPILSIAFNKRIADELKKRLPSHVTTSTINGLGHRAWGAAVGKRLTLDTDKSYNLLRRYIDSQPAKRQDRLFDDFADIKRAIARGKLHGYIPLGALRSERSLHTWESFERSFDEELPPHFHEAIDSVLTLSIKQAYEGSIDFDDQIYMPTLFGGSWPRFPLVLIDETQDLNPLMHLMLELLVAERLMAVGDPLQSIYGFRGSVTDGMSILASRFNMVEFPLTISFRCPKAVVREAHFRAPTMRWPEWAKEGRVVRYGVDDTWSPVDGSAIICRNNAPLFSLAFALIRDGRGVKLPGLDIGPSLVKVLKSFGKESMSRVDAEVALAAWHLKMEAKSRNPGSLKDKRDCLQIFLEQGDTLGAAIAYAEHLFRQEGPVQLMSGHKSKGLEFDYVYHLDPWRIPSGFASTEAEREQELNLQYVITTRAKLELHLVDADAYRAPEAA